MALGAAWLICAQVEKRIFEAARCVVSSVNLDFRRSGQWEVGCGRAIAKKNDATTMIEVKFRAKSLLV